MFNDVLSAIGTLGFPTVACVMLGYFVKYQCDNYREDIEKMTNVINKNNKVLTKILCKLGISEDED